MKKIIYALTVVLATIAGVACTKFDNAEPYTPVTNEQVVGDGYEIVSINELKDVYYSRYGSTTYSVNSVQLSDKKAICGKVISSDQQGNIYRSLYIQDISGYQGGAIELKIGRASMFNDYKVGQVIYVKTDGLVLGTYRFMLSLGSASEEAEYSNGYIDVKSVIDQKILKGAIEPLTAADTIVVNAANISKLKDPDHLGCLVRFEGIKSSYGTVNNTSVGNGSYFSSSDVYPSYLESKNGVYNNYTFEQKGLTPTWAYKYDEDGTTAYYYGSALFTMTVGSQIYPYIIRSSAYSRFALNPLPAKNEVVDITCIYTKYCSSSGGYAKYQLLLNSDEDVK